VGPLRQSLGFSKKDCQPFMSFIRQASNVVAVETILSLSELGTEPYQGLDIARPLAHEQIG
jgi:hypothetical protein